MKILIAQHAGYCFGVRRAVKMLEHTVASHPGPVCTLGPLIHNPRVVAAYQQRGVHALTARDRKTVASGAAIVLPSHGTALAVRRALESKDLLLRDAICPRVLVVQEKILAALSAGRRVFVAGAANHSEVVAYLGLAPRRIRVIESPEDARQLALKKDSAIFLTAQTTFSKNVFQEIESQLRTRARDLDVFDSICGHTLKAQRAAAGLAERCDIMIVIGGRDSANTQALVRACREAGARTRHVEKAAQLRKRDFSPEDRVGVTAGASTPLEHIREVIDWLAARFDVENTKKRSSEFGIRSSENPH